MNGNIIWGIALVLAGFLFLADHAGFIDIDIVDLWPLILVVVGLELILRKRYRVESTEKAGEGGL
nr:hypothetical protein [candidate division Zixibacteria bacterium]